MEANRKGLYQKEEAGQPTRARGRGEGTNGRTDNTSNVPLHLPFPPFITFRQTRQQTHSAPLREPSDDDPLRVEVERVLSDERLEGVGGGVQAGDVFGGGVGELVEG